MTKHYITFDRDELREILVNRPGMHVSAAIKRGVMDSLLQNGWSTGDVMKVFSDDTIITQTETEHIRIKAHVHTHKELPNDVSFVIEIRR